MRASLTWLGHSTVVLELGGTRIVTDPVLTRRVIHLRRLEPLPDTVEPADVVAVSHLHWDHFHVPSLRTLGTGGVLLVPSGAERAVARLGYARVVGVRAGDSLDLDGLEVEVTHAEHAPSRRGRALVQPVGYVLRAAQRVYFAGDTDLFDGMGDIGGQGLDVAVLPVAGWGRNLPAGHLNPSSAVSALELLRPRRAVPVHYGTLAPLGLARLGGSPTAAEDFRAEAASRVPDVQIDVLSIGETLVLGP
jgi:L-ascorbate metabolism protein UlaG (beta-lactamase superfamily)